MLANQGNNKINTSDDLIDHTNIITLLRGNPPSRKAAIKELINNKDFVLTLRAYILKNNGEEDDVKMILTDTIIAFSKQVFMNKDFELKGDLNGYLFGIARFKWLDELKKKKSAILVDNLEIERHSTPQESHLHQLLKSEKATILHNILDVMRTRCKDVLMYWAGGYSMKEIASLLGYQSDGMARKKKSECMKELLAYLSNNPKFKEELRS